MDSAQRPLDGIRRLHDADAGEVLTLQMAAWVIEAIENDTLAIPALHETLTDVRGQLRDPLLTCWGVREAGRLLAMVRTSLLSPTVAFVGRLGVVPDRRGTGLGSAMLRFAEAQLPVDVTRIELVTGVRSVSNHAFYARHGYLLAGPGEPPGTVLMTKSRREPPSCV